MSTLGKESYAIQAVDSALQVLEALSENGEVRISQLSEKLGMTKGKLFRLLATFERRHYVEQTKKTGKYRLGLAAFVIGQKFLSQMETLQHVRPVATQLARTCDEAVYFVVRSDDEVVFLDMSDTTQTIRIMPLVGKRYPIDSTAAGKVIAAFDEKNQAFFCAEESAIRQQGVSVDHGVLGEGIASLAVPLLDGTKKTSACLCLVGPEFRFTAEKLAAELLPRLKEAGRVISSKLAACWA